MTGLPQPRAMPAAPERQPLYFSILETLRCCKCGATCHAGEFVLRYGAQGVGRIETCKRCAGRAWPA